MWGGGQEEKGKKGIAKQLPCSGLHLEDERMWNNTYFPYDTNLIFKNLFSLGNLVLILNFINMENVTDEWWSTTLAYSFHYLIPKTISFGI